MTPAKLFAFAAFVTLPAALFGADAATSAGPAETAKAVTFAKDVAPIFQERCQECHRKGSLAPMSLVTYEETRPWAKAIRQRVITRQMPPWHIDKTVGVQKFKNDISLTDEQIATVVRWVDAGAPMGVRRPPEPKSGAERMEGGQELGPADLVIKSDPYTMAAHHQVVVAAESNIPVTRRAGARSRSYWNTAGARSRITR
jgi:mono/diheme cytochrome c family protein